MISDLFNGWDEDGEPMGNEESISYQKRAEEYYDDKVARAEEVVIWGVLIFAVVTVTAAIAYGIWTTIS
jgi:hypothetical protein